MGQKVNPTGLRIGVIKDWDSRWYASKKDFGDTLVSDNQLRNYLPRSGRRSEGRNRERRKARPYQHSLRKARHGYRQGRRRD